MSASGMARIVDQASRLLDYPEAQERVISEGSDTYELRIFRDWVRLATVYEEIEHLLNLIGRAQTFQEVRLLVKTYVVSWVTLSDALANIVNEVLELDLQPTRVTWSNIQTSEVLKSTTLPQLLREYSERLQLTRMVKLRNDIVHRGWLIDAEYDEVFSDCLSEVVLTDISTGSSNLDDTARSVAREYGVHRKLHDLIEKKRAESRKHLAETFALIEDVSVTLHSEAVRRQRA